MAAPAKVLPAADVRRLLAHVDYQRHPARNCVLILLSFKAGLRACEMASVDGTMLVQSNGKPGTSIEVGRQIAKGHVARRIPLNADLAAALRALFVAEGRPRDGPE